MQLCRSKDFTYTLIDSAMTINKKTVIIFTYRTFLKWSPVIIWSVHLSHRWSVRHDIFLVQRPGILVRQLFRPPPLLSLEKVVSDESCVKSISLPASRELVVIQVIRTRPIMHKTKWEDSILLIFPQIQGIVYSSIYFLLLSPFLTTRVLRSRSQYTGRGSKEE